MNLKALKNLLPERSLLILGTLAALLLLPTLRFPISPDLTIFLYGGKTIADGGSIYVDFVDLKPPFIYLIMAPVYKIFGGSEFSLRLFDYLYQITTILSIFIVVRKRLEREVFAWTASLIYLLLYSGIHFGAAFQCETLMALPLTWAIFFGSGKPTMRNAVYSGALIGAITGLKYTFGVIGVAALIVELGREGEGPLRRALAFAGSAFFALLLTHIPLAAHGSFNGYVRAMHFLQAYASYSKGVGTGLYPLLSNTARFVGDYIGITVFAAVLFGVAHSISQSGKRLNPFFLQAFWIGAALFVSVVIEAKYFGYHWARTYVPIALLAAPGADYLTRTFKSFGNYDLLKKTSIIAIIAAAALFSPYWRVWKNASKAVESLSAPYAFGDYYDKSPEAIKRSLVEWHSIADTLKPILSGNDQVLIVSHGDQPLYYYINPKRIDRFAHSGFYLSPKSTKAYRAEFIEELKTAKAVIFRTDKGDIFNLGVRDSEWDILPKFPEIYNIVKNRYKEYMRTENFITLIHAAKLE